MFDTLGRRLTNMFGSFRRKGRLTEADVDAVLREIRVALLEADVNLLVVKSFMATVKEQLVGSDVIQSLTPDQTIIKIVRDALVDILGTEATKFNYGPQPPTVILMCGLQGSGKTTTTAKLARWLISQGKKPMLAACDLQRPAAIKQLEVLGEQIGVPVFAGQPGGDPVKTAQEALARCKYLMNDVLIVDTAGRTTVDDALMAELGNIARTVKPNEAFLVLDSTTGQESVNVAEAFRAKVEITGAIFTKMDGDTRGGAVLSVRAATGVPVRFLGMGEQVETLDLFDPVRVAERILGMGDVLALIDTMQNAVAGNEEEVASMEQRAMRGDMDFDMMLSMFGMMRKMGPFKKVLGMIPGLAHQIPEEALDQVDERKLDRIKAIIQSMTPRERKNPDLINSSRRKRIARGSGTQVEDVNALIKQLNEMRRGMKQMGSMQKKMRKFDPRRRFWNDQKKKKGDRNDDGKLN
ncbi:MAG: signal recognition particle protein [Armatimonadetes bacterium]|nr:signal recognition particle protein [Armatimonadota bacterium]